MSTRPGFYVVLGDLNRLVVVEDALGLPAPAVRFRTRQHAERIAEKWNADAVTLDVAARFGPGEVVS